MFDLVGSHPEAMLLHIPATNVVINEYQKKPVSGPRQMFDAMWKALEEVNKPKRVQNKRWK